jgi:hypothetical protein
MKTLPIGISTLRFLIEDRMVYVDKTGIILPIAREKGRYFLSRPRRFGKSLLVDTFKELFEGNEPLFRNLAIHDAWDWSRKLPVIKIDFAGGLLRSPQDLVNKLEPVLQEHAREHGLTLQATGLSNRFRELLGGIHARTGLLLVVLVDEYDKPLLDNIENPTIALEMREALKDLYSPLKEMDGILQFVFLTGVTKFSKVNIFSGINNLMDITLNPACATICGYTQQDLETSFAEHLAGVDRDRLKLWYNGYSFLGEAVYNPFDILLFIRNDGLYRNYWFETGTPTFLVKLMQKNRYFLPDLENLEVGDDQMASFELDSIPPAIVLLQSGYLTIGAVLNRMGTIVYQLKVPNQEVRLAFNNTLFHAYTDIFEQRSTFQRLTYDALRAGDLAALEASLRRLFAGIPWRNFTNNDLADYEGYYASVLYAFFSAITCTVIPEDISNHGQADLTIRLGDNIYVMEIKTIPDAADAADAADTADTADAAGGSPDNQPGNSALAQVRARRYADKYLGQTGVRVFELGLVFGMAQRTLAQFAGLERS